MVNVPLYPRTCICGCGEKFRVWPKNNRAFFAGEGCVRRCSRKRGIYKKLASEFSAYRKLLIKLGKRQKRPKSEYHPEFGQLGFIGIKWSPSMEGNPIF